MENAINNNNITLAGVVEREPEYSHEVAEPNGKLKKSVYLTRIILFALIVNRNTQRKRKRN